VECEVIRFCRLLSCGSFQTCCLAHSDAATSSSCRGSHSSHQLLHRRQHQPGPASEAWIGTVMHTRQRDETENDREMSRMIETFRELSRLSRFWPRFLGKLPTTNSRSFTISKTTYTPWPSPSQSNNRITWCFPLVSALDAAKTPVFTTLQPLLPGQLPAVKITVRNNGRERAVSATVLYWPA
jgi:hypothetical protein